MAYPDLTTLFQNLGPTTASMFAGSQQGLAEQDAQAKTQQTLAEIAAAKQKMEQDSQMSPLLLEQQKLNNLKLGLGNQGLSAGLPGITAQSSMLGDQASISKAGVADAIVSQAAAAKSKRIEEAHKQVSTYQKIMEGAIPQLQGVPDAAKPAALQQYMASTGMDLNDPQMKTVMGKFATMKPSQYLPAIEADVKWANEHLPAFVQAMAVGKQSADAQIKGHQISAGATIRAAEIGAKSRESIAASKNHAVDIVSQVQAGKLSAEKAAVAFDTMAAMETDPQQKALYNDQARKMEQVAMQLRAAGAGQKADLGAMGVPVKPVNPIFGGEQPKPKLPPGVRIVE